MWARLAGVRWCGARRLDFKINLSWIWGPRRDDGGGAANAGRPRGAWVCQIRGVWWPGVSVGCAGWLVSAWQWWKYFGGAAQTRRWIVGCLHTFYMCCTDINLIFLFSHQWHHPSAFAARWRRFWSTPTTKPPTPTGQRGQQTPLNDFRATTALSDTCLHHQAGHHERHQHHHLLKRHQRGTEKRTAAQTRQKWRTGHNMGRGRSSRH
eukprot:SAG22_NODE_8468_length_653_cov_4.301444_1_plen_207_part_01